MKYIKYNYGMCIECGNVGEVIHHHIKYRTPRTNGNKRNNGDVCVDVCRSCHRLIHKVFPKIWNKA